MCRRFDVVEDTEDQICVFKNWGNEVARAEAYPGKVIITWANRDHSKVLALPYDLLLVDGCVEWWVLCNDWTVYKQLVVGYAKVQLIGIELHKKRAGAKHSLVVGDVIEVWVTTCIVFRVEPWHLLIIGVGDDHWVCIVLGVGHFESAELRGNTLLEETAIELRLHNAIEENLAEVRG